MMNKQKKDILNFNFHKLIKAVIIITLLAIVSSGCITAVMVYSNAEQVESVAESLQQWDDMDDQQKDDIDGSIHSEDISIKEITRVLAPISGVIIAAGIFVLICAGTVISFWIILAMLVRRYAIEIGSDITLWTMLGVFTGPLALVGIILYKKLTRKKCPSCGKWQKESQYCGNCGAMMQVICPECSHIGSVKDEYCKFCGKKLKK